MHRESGLATLYSRSELSRWRRVRALSVCESYAHHESLCDNEQSQQLSIERDIAREAHWLFVTLRTAHTTDMRRSVRN